MTIEQQAARLHTHRIVFHSGSNEEDVATRAMAGHTTKGIATALGLTMGQVNYYIKKAGLIGERGAYRSGQSQFAAVAYRALRAAARRRVQSEIAPKFVPYQDR